MYYVEWKIGCPPPVRKLGAGTIIAGLRNESESMQFIRNDGGRKEAGFKGSAGDCVVRAVAIASGRPYREVYDVLSEGCRAQRVTRRGRKKSSARDGVTIGRKWFKEYMQALGFEWVPCMKIGTGCRVHLVREELPMGRLVVRVSKHVCAVIDGVIHDTHDPQRWTMITENGVTRTAARCVYGYWRLKE